jgi:hypothetical protein
LARSTQNLPTLRHLVTFERKDIRRSLDMASWEGLVGEPARRCRCS